MPPILTAPRLQLGQGLRELRTRAGMNTSQTSELLGLKQLSTYRRYEHGEIKIPLPHLKVLMMEWGVTDEERARLFELHGQADQDVWWSRYPMTESMSRLLGFESVATSIQGFEPLMVPGQLQTERYARAVIPGIEPPEVTTEQIEQFVHVRMERQRRTYKRPGRPKQSFVLDESVIRRNIAGREVMHEQLRALTTVDPECEVRILPLGVDAHPGLSGAFYLFDFPANLRKPAVHVDSHRRALYLDIPTDVERARVDFDRLREASLSREDSRELILTVMEELKQ